MSEHTCQCRHCEPDLFVSGSRIDVGHFAVRLGDGPPKNLAVFINGEQNNDVTEVLVNPNGDGIAFVFSTKKEGRHHLCECRESLCEEMISSSDISVRQMSTPQ